MILKVKIKNKSLLFIFYRLLYLDARVSWVQKQQNQKDIQLFDQQLPHSSSNSRWSLSLLLSMTGRIIFQIDKTAPKN